MYESIPPCFPEDTTRTSKDGNTLYMQGSVQSTASLPHMKYV